MAEATDHVPAAGAEPQGAARDHGGVREVPVATSAEPGESSTPGGWPAGGAAAGEVGEVRIAEDVVAVIAGIAATGVEGVAAMAGGLVGGIGDLFGKKSPSRGVRVELGDNRAAIDLYIVVEYGVRIPRVAQRVQEAVKQAVEGMTGLEVVEVNVHVQGVSFPTEERPPQESRIR